MVKDNFDWHSTYYNYSRDKNSFILEKFTIAKEKFDNLVRRYLTTIWIITFNYYIIFIIFLIYELSCYIYMIFNNVNYINFINFTNHHNREKFLKETRELVHWLPISISQRKEDFEGCLYTPTHTHTYKKIIIIMEEWKEKGRHNDGTMVSYLAAYNCEGWIARFYKVGFTKLLWKKKYRAEHYIKVCRS